MNVCDDFRPGNRENVAVVQQVFFVVGIAFAARRSLIQTVGPDGGAHGAVQNENPFGERCLKFCGGIGLWHGGNLASHTANSSFKSSYPDMMMGCAKILFANLTGSTPAKRIKIAQFMPISSTFRR